MQNQVILWISPHIFQGRYKIAAFRWRSYHVKAQFSNILMMYLNVQSLYWDKQWSVEGMLLVGIPLLLSPWGLRFHCRVWPAMFDWSCRDVCHIYFHFLWVKVWLMDCWFVSDKSSWQFYQSDTHNSLWQLLTNIWSFSF